MCTLYIKTYKTCFTVVIIITNKFHSFFGRFIVYRTESNQLNITHFSRNIVLSRAVS